MFQILNFKLRDENGFTLLESIVDIAVFLIIFLSLFSLFTVVLRTIRDNKAITVANNIALEQLEIIRKMDFNDIATDTGWVPPGPIPSERVINRSGLNFTVKVDIAFADDPYDDLDPQDTFPFDYKKARVRVIWKNYVTGNQEVVAMSTTIAPKGLEGLSAGKGGLLITVFNASGEAVYSADVHIESNSLGYSVDAQTDLNGNLWVPDLEPADDYHIVVTKAGYSTDQTYAVDNDPSSPTYNPNPTKPDATVVEGEVTKLGFAIDVLGNLDIKTVNYNNPQNWRVNTDTGADSQTEVDLDIDSGNNVILAWLDDRSGADRIYAQKYKYNSSTGLFDQEWASDVQITTANNKETPKVAVYNTSYFYIVWTDARNGNEDVYLQKFNSSDGSPVWNDVKVNIDENSADQIRPSLAVDSAGNVYVAWMDNRNGDWDIYAQKWDTNGNSMWSADLRVNSDVGSANQENPKIVVDDEDNFYVVWEDEINGDKDIFMAKFDSSGNTLFAGKKVNTDSSLLDQYEPTVVFDGSNYLYIAWADKRNSQPDIYAQKYDKLGNIATDGNWASGDVKINDDSMPTAWRTKPTIAYSSLDNVLYFSWEDDRNGDSDVYSAKFDANGNKLWTYDLIMNGVSNGIQDAPATVVDSEGYGITAWEDERSGDFDIYLTRYKDMGFFVRVGVPITVTGAKLKGTYPNDSPPPANLPIYKYSETFTSDSGGNISIGDGMTALEWDSYSFSTDDSHTIVSADRPMPLDVNPGAAETIILNIEP